MRYPLPPIPVGKSKEEMKRTLRDQLRAMFGHPPSPPVPAAPEADPKRDGDEDRPLDG